MSAALPVPATCEGCPCPEPSTTPVPGASGAGVTVEVESAGANCPNGGVKITSAAGVTYVCNGEDGAASTITVEPEAPGANCEFGGIKITTDAGVEYVCNGGCVSPCTDGSDGVSSFTVTTADFTQPAIGSDVTLDVLDSSWIAVGEPMFVTIGGSYLVVSVPGPTQVELKNLGYAGNASPTTNVTTGKIVTPSGLKGDTGAAGPATALSHVNLSDNVVSADAAQAIAFGAWTTKRLQTSDPAPGGALVSLVGNQFILATGTYLVNGFIFTEQAYARLRIRDVTSPATLLQGVNMANLNNSSAMVPINGRITTTSALTLELQYWAQNNGGATVLGIPMTPNDPAIREIYAAIDFLKIA